MARNKPNQIISDFIEMYRSEPCLWQVKSHDYHDRMKRDDAYTKLAKKLDEIEPGATKKSVINKVSSLRSAFRKEKKKVEASKKSGSSADSIYKPALWYYDLFDFLQDQDTPKTSISNLDSEGEEESIDNSLPVEEIMNADVEDSISKTADIQDVSTIQTKLPIISRPGTGKRKKINDDLTAEVLTTVRDHFKTPPEQFDRYDLLGKSIAVKLRGLEKRQALMAEKKIDTNYASSAFVGLRCGDVPANASKQTCDDKMKIRYVHTQYPGNNHDSHISIS
ncbi:uncharacterized protein LOC129248746 [Anastrepha obliqua]|uniref:uncharacterized protein LOC129248746 n=1 Tax=Anastrepha obliqua TaxID=95512 RepID=UPI00240964CE|nr:uncharacterized protein LOC129248746 [Anastrepha obliqua]